MSDDANRVRQAVSGADQRKLDEYFQSVREIEERIARASSAPKDIPDLTLPEGVPSVLAEHTQLMFDILLVAFQTDSTRIATLMLADAGSNRSYPEIDVREGHHELSHHQDDKDKMEKIARIDRYLVERFSYFLEKLKSTTEGDSNLLHNSMILYGSAISDGNRHSHDDLPIILAGRGGGTIQTGRYVNHPNETPLNNLFLAMADRMGAKLDNHGDSKGVLDLS